MDVVTRIKNLENLRRTARAASEHDLADQLTAQIDALRKERAQARPLHERITSALRKQELAQHDLTRATEALQKATERRTIAAETVTEATRELEKLRQEEQEQQAGPDAAPPEDHLLEYFDELVDAVQATPDARTARILSALNAVRTILLKDAEDAEVGDTSDSYHHDMDTADGSEHTEMAHETATSRASTPTPRSSSPDYKTNSKRAACSTSTSPKAPRRATMGRSTTILARAAPDRTQLRPDAGAGHRQQGGEPAHATERRVHAVPRCEGRTTFFLFFSPLRQLNAALSLTRRVRAHCPHHWQCVHAEPHHYLRPCMPRSFLLFMFMLRSYLLRQEGSKSLPG